MSPKCCFLVAIIVATIQNPTYGARENPCPCSAPVGTARIQIYSNIGNKFYRNGSEIEYFDHNRQKAYIRFGTPRAGVVSVLHDGARKMKYVWKENGDCIATSMEYSKRSCKPKHAELVEQVDHNGKLLVGWEIKIPVPDLYIQKLLDPETCTIRRVTSHHSDKTIIHVLEYDVTTGISDYSIFNQNVDNCVIYNSKPTQPETSDQKQIILDLIGKIFASLKKVSLRLIEQMEF